jgi:ElaB/YqjD/DUF883 family membrane-anchored ribosome-binding protein
MDHNTNGGITVREVAFQATDFIKRQADRRSRELGGRLNAAADELEHAGDDMRDRGQDITASVARQLAQAARRVGYYLETTDTDRMLEDAKTFTREQPWTVVAIGMVAGFALSRVVKHAIPGDSGRA